MAAQLGSKRNKLAAKPSQNSTASNGRKIESRKAAAKPSKAKKRAGPKSNEPASKTQKTLRPTPKKANYDHKTRIQSGKPLTDVQIKLEPGQLKRKRLRQAETRRRSFVVRITIDDNGQPGRTEVEDVHSNGKQNFPTLDGELLVTFMRECIHPEDNLKTPNSTALSFEKEEASIQAPHMPNFSLSITDVQAFRPANPDSATLIFTSAEPFIVQTRFHIQGEDARLPTSTESPYEVKVFFNEVTSGKSGLCTTHHAKLTRHVLEYTTSVEVPGLPLGLYRLFTTVTLSEPFKTAQFYQNTIIQAI